MKVSVKKIFSLLFILFLNFTFIQCSNEVNNPVEPPDNIEENVNPFEQNKKLGRGINLGNALEAPKEGDWGVILKEEYFRLIKEKGFNSVRIPIKWSAHALQNPPYTIDENFFKRVDWAISKSFENKLAVVINVHHYDEIMKEPQNHKERFLMIWDQISKRYSKYSSDLMFEILNEPNSQLTTDIWNSLIAETLPVIRKDNPNRTLIIGTANWGGVDNLNSLKIPVDEKNVIVTFHYYNPFQFTHQGAEWVLGSDVWLGTKWYGSTQEQNAVISDMEKALAWSNTNQRPLYLGEFGAYSKADLQSRAMWTNFVARAAEQKGFSWAYWEFCSGFGIYNSTTGTWVEPLLNALIPGV